MWQLGPFSTLWAQHLYFILHQKHRFQDEKTESHLCANKIGFIEKQSNICIYSYIQSLFLSYIQPYDLSLRHFQGLNILLVNVIQGLIKYRHSRFGLLDVTCSLDHLDIPHFTRMSYAFRDNNKSLSFSSNKSGRSTRYRNYFLTTARMTPLFLHVSYSWVTPYLKSSWAHIAKKKETYMGGSHFLLGFDPWH